MDQTVFTTIAITGFAVAFAHAAIPTHWLPFVLAARGQKWSKSRTMAIVVLCGLGHVLFTTLLGAMLVWFGIKSSSWLGTLFPVIAGGALVLLGLYYLWRQFSGKGHGHSHFAGGHAHGSEGHEGHDHGGHDHGGHDHGGHSHGAHDHGDETKRIDTGHGVLILEIFEDGVPPRFQLRTEAATMRLPSPGSVRVETLRPGGARQVFSFVQRDGYLESQEDIPEPHSFTADLTLSHGDHGHSHRLEYLEPDEAEAAKVVAGASRSDAAVIGTLFLLLTFSPCEGFLPVYFSAVKYGWQGFMTLSVTLALATIAGMAIFTWLTMSGLERFKLRFLARWEAGILGALVLFLGLGIIFWGF